jgi:hypothetical protein
MRPRLIDFAGAALTLLVCWWGIVAFTELIGSWQ